MTIILPVANLINLIIENWQISIIAFAVFASLCLGLFKGIKHGIRALAIVLVLVVLWVCGRVVYGFVVKDLDGLINFGIAWLPTILFVIAVLLSTLVGVHRGLRKSLILLLHSVIIAVICIGAYFFCVTSPVVDEGLLSLINVFMGEGGLQSTLGVRADCETIREVLLELIDGYAVNAGEFGILLQSNSAYVMTLINMAYRIVFALVFFILYELLLFILFIIYLIFYSERKYKKKRNIRFSMNKTDCSYSKRPVGGGCVGLVRGLISGIISISFIGSILFIAVGGKGASKLPEDISFGENYDPYVSIYRSIEDYDAQGIFKILNAISDPNDTPYYLFAADIVFSGGLDDELHGVSGHIKFREELAAYTGFAKNTLALLMKYDTDGTLAAIMRGDGGDDVMDKVLSVCTKPEFRVEFDNLIDNFDAQTYIINFALSLADAIIANIDDMSFMNSVSADNKELLQIMFKRGYLSDTIPDERERKQTTSGEITQDIPPYLTINHLFTKKDAQIILNVVLSILSNEVDVKDPASIAGVLVPDVENLSILSSERSKEMDPVLGRLYCYFDNKYLTEDGEDGITYAEVKNEEVYWTKEIRALLGVADGLVTFYNEIQGNEDNDIFNSVSALFDESNENYAENCRMYEELTAVVSDSALLSKVLCSGKVSDLLNTQLKKISENFYFPDKISYANKYDEEGNLLSYGEAYHLMRGLRLLVEKENKELIDSLTESSSSFEDLIKKLAETITKDDPNAHGNSLASYLTESVLLRSAISAVICDRAGDMLVVPALSLEKNEKNETVNLINKPELREIFEALPELVDLILPFASEDVTAEEINNVLENDRFNSLLDNGNKIVEGTIAKALIDMLSNNSTVIISKRLENYEEWITVGEPGELRKFMKTIDKDHLSLDVKVLMEGGGLDGEEIYDKLKNLDGERIDELLESEVFHYSASKMMDDGDFGFDDFNVIVPVSSCTLLSDDKLPRVIKRDELASVFYELKDLGLSSDMDNDKVVEKLVRKKEILQRSDIISVSVVNFIVTHENICSSLSIPQSYIDAGAEDRLRDYDSSNVWSNELPNMIDAVDEIFGISNMPEGEGFSFDGDAVSEKTNELLKSLNERSVTKPDSTLTRLDVCYASDILKNNITVELDKALDGVVEADVIASAKSGGYYTDYELRALSETAGIFDLDILKIDNNELAGKVKKEILTLNDPRADDMQGRSTLDIMFPSAIIRYFVTDEIDKALNGDDQSDESLIDIEVRDSFKTNSQGSGTYPKSEISALVDALGAIGIDDIDSVKSTDRFTSVSNYRNNIDEICASGIVTGIITKQIDKSLTDDIIDSGVRVQIKGRNKSYSAEEISALIGALDELGMGDFTEFETVDFSQKIKSLRDPATSGNGTKLTVVYKSDIAVGAFTKTVKDTFDENEDLVYHPSANRSDLAVLKEQEIDTLITLLGDVDLDNFDVSDIPLTKVRAHIVPESNGNPRSYLLSANLTLSLIKNVSLYVPSSVYKNDLINADEELRFTDALMALQGETPINQWTVEDHMVLPEKDKRESILKSEIMRATFSHYVFTNENNTDIIFEKENVNTTARRVTRNGESSVPLAVISDTQLNDLFNVLDGCIGNELVIPSFGDLSAIRNSDIDVNVLYEFDVTRYRMSDVILSDPMLSVIMPDYQQYVTDGDCYKFENLDGFVAWSGVTAQALTREGILTIIDG